MALLAETKRKVKYGLDPQNTQWSNDESKFGQRLMEKMGWEKGKGLGANENGMTEHIRASYKWDQRGLGATAQNSDAWVAHQDDFNDILQRLNAGKTEEEEKPQDKKVKVVDGQKRFYGRFARGRVQKLRTTEDLDCIFGKRKTTSEPTTPANQSVANSDDESPADHDKQSNLEDTKTENSHGLTTVTSTTSVQDYFARKMRELQERRKLGGGGAASVSNSDAMDTQSEQKQEDGEGKRSPAMYGQVCFSYDKEGADKVKSEMDVNNDVIQENHDNVVSDEKKSKKKKKKEKKEKNKEEEEAVIVDAGVSNDNGETAESNSKKKKKKDKKERKEKEEELVKTDEVMTVGDVENAEKSSKKKKKKKSKDSKEVEETAEVVELKTKQEQKESESSDKQVNDQTLGKKKKKKKRETDQEKEEEVDTKVKEETESLPIKDEEKVNIKSSGKEREKRKADDTTEEVVEGNKNKKRKVVEKTEGVKEENETPKKDEIVTKEGKEGKPEQVKIHSIENVNKGKTEKTEASSKTEEAEDDGTSKKRKKNKSIFPGSNFEDITGYAKKKPEPPKPIKKEKIQPKPKPKPESKVEQKPKLKRRKLNLKEINETMRSYSHTITRKS